MKYQMFFLLLLILSCKEEYQKELSGKAFTKSDSIYNSLQSQFIIEADSLCELKRKDYLMVLVDSILLIRREQVKQLRSLE